MKKYFIAYLFISILFSQNWKPYHSEELEKNVNANVNFELIDYIARQIPEYENNFRNQLTHEVIGYLPYWEYAIYPTLDYNLITQLNYFSIEINQYGDIVDNHNWNDLYLIEFAHERDVKVKLCATLFGETELNILLSNQNHRENAINNLLELVINKNADGIDIDFELLPSNQRENLVLFVQELSETFHNAIEDPIITMATPAIDWSNAWDYNTLASITDGLFIMGYNYFYSSSSFAGPVSPLGEYFYDLEYTVSDYLEKTGNQNDKIILGLPYYGYDWPVQNELMNSETTNSGISRTYSSALSLLTDYDNNWNNDSNSSWIAYQNNDYWQQCWYDDSLSLSRKYQFAINNNLSGIGIWALGYDNGHNQLWGAISDQFTIISPGDFNADNIINILDVILIVNMILGYTEIQENADLNQDQIINIIDVITLINIILS